MVNDVSIENHMFLFEVAAASLSALGLMLIVSATDWEYSAQMLSGISVGGFVGMASTSHLSTLYHVASAGIISGAFMLLFEPFFNGFGGKEGFEAFLGCTTVVVFSKFIFGKEYLHRGAGSK